MGHYYNVFRGEVRQLDAALVAEWQASDNPKAAEWVEVGPPPAGATGYDGIKWVVQSEAEILEQRRAQMVVSPFQARSALSAYGLLEQAEAAVAKAPEQVQLAWQYAQEFRRNSPTLLALCGALGLTDAQLDGLFEAASQITA